VASGRLGVDKDRARVGRLCAEAGGWLGAEGSAARRGPAYGRRSRR